MIDRPTSRDRSDRRSLARVRGRLATRRRWVIKLTMGAIVVISPITNLHGAAEAERWRLEADGTVPSQPRGHVGGATATEALVEDIVRAMPHDRAGAADRSRHRGFDRLSVASTQTSSTADRPDAEPILVPVQRTEPDLVSGRLVVRATLAGGSADIVGAVAGSSEQIAVVLQDASAPLSYGFRIDEANRPSLRFHLDGRTAVIVRRSDGRAVGHVAAPWAVTSSGAAVPTWFTTDGDLLVQHVDHRGIPSEAYPVVADPDVTKNCGWVTCTWYWSVAATHRLADRLLAPNGGIAYGVTSAVVCAVLAASVVGGLACSLIYTAGMGYFSRELWQADRYDRCFTVSTPPRGTFGSVGQGNSRCVPK